MLLQALSSKVSMVATLEDGLRQPGDCVSSKAADATDWSRWRRGLRVVQDAVPGDVLLAVPRNEVLVASSRTELVLAVMEGIHQMRAVAGNDNVQHGAWLQTVIQSSGRLALRLLNGCDMSAVIDALSGKAPCSVTCRASESQLCCCHRCCCSLEAAWQLC